MSSMLANALAALPLDERFRVVRNEFIRRKRAQRSVEPFAKYVHDPVSFAREQLGMTLWSRQNEILESVDRHSITAVASGQKVGKTTDCAVATYWWIATRVRGLVVMTTGNADQLRAQLWAELQAIDARSGIVERLGAKLNDDPSNGLRMPDGRYAIGLTPKDQVRMAGYSGDELLVIIDEASGFDDAKWGPVRGNLLGGGHALVCGNATKNSGFFFEFFTTRKGEANAIRVSSTETPNYIEGRRVLPGLASREEVDKLIREYGVEHPIVQVRVFGMHATSSARGVIGLGHLEAAIKRWTPQLWADAEGRLALGVDVARFGDDDSVIQPVRGSVAGPSVVVHGQDTVDVVGRTLALARELRRTERFGMEKPIVVVDTAGVGGGVADQLRRVSEVELYEADSAANANEKDKHHRLRDELWWNLREWMATAALPPDNMRDQELLAPEYSFDAEARTLVESKEQIKRKLEPRRSPDRGDALCLAVGRPRRGIPIRTFHVRGL